MQAVLLVIHLIVVVALIGTVLLQRSEGGVLGSGGGGGFMTGRGQANALSRATAILATIYFVTALAMSMLAGWSRASRSILESTPAATSTPTPTPASSPSPGSLLDQLNKPETGTATPGSPTPAAPDTASPSPAPAPSETPK